MAMLRIPPSARDHRRGDPEAPIVMVEYGDYQCPHCAAAEPVVEALLSQFADLQAVFRHFPLTEIHPLADVCAQSAEFAGDKNQFWALHEALFANQRELGLETIFAITSRLGLSQQELRGALETRTYADKVRQDFIGGVRSGVNGTPTFFVNGLRHDGPHDFESLAQALLATRAPAAGVAPGDVRPSSPS